MSAERCKTITQRDSTNTWNKLVIKRHNMRTERSKTSKTAKCKDAKQQKERQKTQKTIRYAKDSQIDKTTRKRGKASRCRQKIQ